MTHSGTGPVRTRSFAAARTSWFAGELVSTDIGPLLKRTAWVIPTQNYREPQRRNKFQPQRTQSVCRVGAARQYRPAGPTLQLVKTPAAPISFHAPPPPPGA